MKPIIQNLIGGVAGLALLCSISIGMGKRQATELRGMEDRSPSREVITHLSCQNADSCRAVYEHNPLARIVWRPNYEACVDYLKKMACPQYKKEKS